VSEGHGTLLKMPRRNTIMVMATSVVMAIVIAVVMVK
jgi:hypothetical protein